MNKIWERLKKFSKENEDWAILILGVILLLMLASYVGKCANPKAEVRASKYKETIDSLVLVADVSQHRIDSFQVIIDSLVLIKDRVKYVNQTKTQTKYEYIYTEYLTYDSSDKVRYFTKWNNELPGANSRWLDTIAGRQTK